MRPAADDDTIAAVATASGRGGIGIVRLSGPDARRIGECLAGGALRPRHAHHRLFRTEEGTPLDDGIALLFPGPASFTGEDVVELQGHGGAAVLAAVLGASLSLGARLARPGEFTERAFLNDRMDLAQAEAVADLVDAASAEAATAALRSLQGEFSDRVRGLMDATTDLRVWVEAALDFPDEDVDFIADGDVEGRVTALRARIDSVRVAARQGVLLREGMTLVLAGAPNAGKSSLLNRFAGRDTAIVTAVAGTTRDVLREQIDLDGLPLHLVDTAGLRATSDAIEVEGMRRARAEIERADLLLWLVDASTDAELPRDRDALEAAVGAPLPRAVRLVRNKIDLLAADATHSGTTLPTSAVSVRTGAGMEALIESVKGAVGFGTADRSPFTARARHLVALEEADAACAAALETLLATGAGDLVAEDLRHAQDALGRIVGAVTPDDLLGEIFSSFCIGK